MNTPQTRDPEDISEDISFKLGHYPRSTRQHWLHLHAAALRDHLLRLQTLEQELQHDLEYGR